MNRSEVIDYFPPGPEDADSQALVEQWRISLSKIIDHLGSAGSSPEIQCALQDKLAIWASEKPDQPDHGIWHSFNVYQGMKWISQQEGQSLPDHLAQAAAVLHDLVQSMPWIHPTDGRPFKSNQRKLHAVAMSKVLHQIGPLLGLKPEDVRDLALSIRVHDAAYQGRHYADLPYMAQVLSDADKLFGALAPMGTVADFVQNQLRSSVELAITRNAKGGLYKGVGWYYFNPDLTLEQRNLWRYGDRWNLDSVSALRREFFQMMYYTSTAQVIDQHKQTIAAEVIIDQARISYDRANQWVNEYKRRVAAGERVNMYWVGLGFEKGDRLVERVPDDVTLPEALRLAYDRPLEVPPTVAKPGFTAKGWKLSLEDGGILLDPSIAQYLIDDESVGLSSFLSALRSALTV